MGIFNWYHDLPEESGGKKPNKQSNNRPKAPRVLPPKSQGPVQAGGLPDAATQRLGAQGSRQGTAQHLWTGNLSVNELLLTRQCGFMPLGQVMGTSVYQVGVQWTGGAWGDAFLKGESVGYELDVLTNGFLQARSLALGRLKQEAALLGATGIIGVEIQRRKTEWENGLLEFSAIGTAIRETHLSRAPSPVTQKPKLFLSELSGQEYWQLRQAGFRPVGIAIGYCVYCQLPDFNTQNMLFNSWLNPDNWRNEEVLDFTSGLYSARALAMRRMEEDAIAAEATSIVSVDVNTKIELVDGESTANNRTKNNRTPRYPMQKMICHFSAVGTAIKEFPMQEESTPPDLTVSLGSQSKNLK